MNWNIYNTNLSHITNIYFVNSVTGYLITSQGNIYKTTTGGVPIGIKPISNEIPETFFLYQNYPNPFNPTTKIKFSIPTPLNPPFAKGGTAKSGGFVKLIVYDILGREVEILINESATGGLKPGTYEVEWNANNYPGGVYFYQLKIDNEQLAAKKMVLIK